MQEVRLRVTRHDNKAVDVKDNGEDHMHTVFSK